MRNSGGETEAARRAQERHKEQREEQGKENEIGIKSKKEGLDVERGL